MPPLFALVLGRSPQGFTALTVLVTIIGGMILVSLWIIGEYVGRIYEEVKRRPIYLVDRMVGGDADLSRLRATAGSMDPRYGAEYARLYREHWWWRAREEYLTRLLDRVIGPNDAGETFDFGCGDGLLLPDPPALQPERPRGLETDASLLDPAGPWFDRITTGALVDDPSERARYGLIVALDVLEHLEHPQPAMAILRARLRPGGWFIATVPAFDELWTAHDEVNHHYRRYRLREIEASCVTAAWRSSSHATSSSGWRW